ncbi:hypothetical protein VTK73DRAFT_2539 [Phialemonium thermophilum]|uniref:Uncharacterized protein n=1 Tax=Phialemonium thermophilum TaxID=223376 RepID=A0ABR3X3P9_9PEZI
MPSQRPFFLSSFFAALRQPAASGLSGQQPNKSASSATPYQSQSSPGSGARAVSTSANNSTSSASASSSSSSSAGSGGVVNQLPIHASSRSQPQQQQHHHHHHSPIPIPQSGADRRRGSDSSSEGFREVLGADKWYIGGRTAAGEEKFFRLGVVRRVRSRDRLSLDRLSL